MTYYRDFQRIMQNTYFDFADENGHPAEQLIGCFFQ